MSQPAIAEKPAAQPKVLVEIEGGVARVSANPAQVRVAYVDYDNDPDAVPPRDYVTLPQLSDSDFADDD